MLRDIVRAVRDLLEKLYPSNPSTPLPSPDPDQRTATQDVREGAPDPLTRGFLDSGEDVLDATRVLLFGVPFVSLQLVPSEIRKYRYGNKLLQQQLLQEDAGLARIYGFSFEGQYYKLSKPFVFVVFGPGRSRIENRPASVANWGTEDKEFQFADDIRVWEMDKEDVTLRLDVTSGFLSDILIDPAFNGSPDMSARQHLVARQHMVDRPDLAARQHLVSRVEMSARHRARD